MFKNINRIVKIMVTSDLIMYSGWGLITPILAVYILDKIEGGNVQVAGIAVGVYWVVKALVQVPLAHFLDKNHGEKDDYYSLVGGIILTSLTPIGFIFATLPWHMYALQAIHAIGMAMVVPSWAGIYTRHIQKKREAFCWGLDSSAISIGLGVGGIVGGIIAKMFGFIPIFIAVSLMGFVSATLLLIVGSKDILPKERIYPIPKP
ncbi:hypothetical protein AMJ47_00910 [Parcubacteria bacterium DG_72]|nr:MAG: hypothetical protein AMJ47_00910 [Parcubacteria bacterium DG_72]